MIYRRADQDGSILTINFVGSRILQGTLELACPPSLEAAAPYVHLMDLVMLGSVGFRDHPPNQAIGGDPPTRATLRLIYPRGGSAVRQADQWQLTLMQPH